MIRTFPSTREINEFFSKRAVLLLDPSICLPLRNEGHSFWCWAGWSNQIPHPKHFIILDGLVLEGTVTEKNQVGSAKIPKLSINPPKLIFRASARTGWGPWESLRKNDQNTSQEPASEKVVFRKGDAVLSKKLYSLGTWVSGDSGQSLEAARVAIANQGLWKPAFTRIILFLKWQWLGFWDLWPGICRYLPRLSVKNL